MGLPSRIYPLLLLLLAPLLPAQMQPVQATTVPLVLPGGLAYDSVGNLYFAETANHVVRRVSPTGILTTVAGTGVQGYLGDGGVATAALLDSPIAVVLDSATNLYIADSHNHRIRRVDALSGTITTVTSQVGLPTALAFDPSGNLYVADARSHTILRVNLATGATARIAGNGTQGFSGDGGPATGAAIDSPSGIAFDLAGNLYLADTHNHRLRRVDHATGVITSVAGTGLAAFSGDHGSSSGSSLNLPRGLAVDASGNLFIVDANNQRIRRIDAVTGQITTIGGQGTQTFLGDGQAAVAASLNTPRAITISPANLPTIADSANQRIRQIDSAAVIHTIAGLGTTTAGTLKLAGPSVSLYGTGSLIATLATSPATGSVQFFESMGANSQSLGVAPLAANAAALSTGSLSTGIHRIFATYPGDTLHSTAQSDLLGLTISAAPAIATPNPVNLQYGQSVPVLTGSLTGILPQDSGRVSLALSTQASPTASPGSYPITASIAGSSAGNYALTQSSAAVTIAKAPSTAGLSNTLAVHVASTTAGVPSGAVSLFDAGLFSQTATLSATGDATFPSTGLSTGTHTLTASYLGDIDFLPSDSAPVVATIGPVAAPDFSLATSGPSGVTVAAGSAAQFSFVTTAQNGALSSPILLTVSGLPAGASASFNPAYLPPGSAPTTFVLTVQTLKTAGLLKRSLIVFALLLPVGLLARRRRAIFLSLMLMVTAGCGDRINGRAISAASATYNITVIATATSASGGTIQHTAGVTLTIQ